MTTPVAMRGNGRLESVEVVDTQNKVEKSKFSAGLAISATGFRGIPLFGLPFDEESGVLENEGGRITQGGVHLNKAYTTGWIKRGPRGVIGTNKKCAAETVRNLLADFDRDGISTVSSQPSDREDFWRTVAPNRTSLQDWCKLDRAEVKAGAAFGRPRKKFTSINDMLNHIAT